MSGPPTVRAFAADEWRTYRDLRLRALTDSPDAFGSTLALEEGCTDAEWRERLEAGTRSPLDLPLVAEGRSGPAGLLWGKIHEAERDVARLYQMWVAPEDRRCGAGHRLLVAVIEWAIAAEVRSLVLGVTLGDTPATRLYAHSGFEWIGQPEPIRPGSALMGRSMQLDLRERSS